MTKELEQHILAGFAGHHERLLNMARRLSTATKVRFVVVPFWNMGSNDQAIYDREQDRITELRVTVVVENQSKGYTQWRHQAVEERIELPKELACGG